MAFEGSSEAFAIMSKDKNDSPALASSHSSVDLLCFLSLFVALKAWKHLYILRTALSIRGLWLIINFVQYVLLVTVFSS